MKRNLDRTLKAAFVLNGATLAGLMAGAGVAGPDGCLRWTALLAVSEQGRRPSRHD